jgi:hypothetical protein
MCGHGLDAADMQCARCGETVPQMIDRDEVRLTPVNLDRVLRVSGATFSRRLFIILKSHLYAFGILAIVLLAAVLMTFIATNSGEWLFRIVAIGLWAGWVAAYCGMAAYLSLFLMLEPNRSFSVDGMDKTVWHAFRLLFPQLAFLLLLWGIVDARKWELIGVLSLSLLSVIVVTGCGAVVPSLFFYAEGRRETFWSARQQLSPREARALGETILAMFVGLSLGLVLGGVATLGLGLVIAVPFWWHAQAVAYLMMTGRIVEADDAAPRDTSPVATSHADQS